MVRRTGLPGMSERTNACCNGCLEARCGPILLKDPFSLNVFPVNYALRFGRTVWGVVPPAGARGAGRMRIAPILRQERAPASWPAPDPLGRGRVASWF